QVISNLVSNAHKYTLDGGRITLSAVQDAAGTLVTVTDTGVGLTPAEICNLFTKFYRARNRATPWNVPGTGLGLAIARALIERHGGSISIVSAPGKGSTFEMRLPPGRIQH
ncbi:MAG TPA: ATP-binding protein, partial [Propionibacteriaceae bacterium]